MHNMPTKLFALLALSLASIVTVSVRAEEALEFSSSHRVGCVAELGGYHFNLKELSLPINE